MAELTKKKQRIINHALHCLFTCDSFFACTSIKDYAVKNALARELRLRGNRVIFLSDTGLAQIRTIVKTIFDADVFDGLVGYADIWSAFKYILEDLLSNGTRPDDVVEFLELIHERLRTEISNYTYAVPLFGVEMDGIDTIALGSMKIVRSPVPSLEDAGVVHDHADLPNIIDKTKLYLWLIGSAEGTPLIAQENFRKQAQLAVGMLAVSAASIYECGASAFRIGVVMSPEDVHGRSIWLSWNDRNPKLTTHYKFIGSQQFKINSDLLEQFAATSTFASVFKIFESNTRTKLEEAIVKGFYWFSDAHRDPVPVMSFIKYWSCVETFFSADNKDITRSVSNGLAAVLAYGGFDFVPETDYHSIKKRVAKLYNLRSRAVHGAVYDHISERNVSELSQWAAWMLINMLYFVECGHSEVGQIKAITDRLDQEIRGRIEK